MVLNHNNLNNDLFNPEKKKKKIEEKIAEHIALPTKNFINKSYFLCDKSNLIKKNCYCNQQAIIALWFFQLFFRNNYSHKFKTDQLK